MRIYVRLKIDHSESLTSSISCDMVGFGCLLYTCLFRLVNYLFNIDYFIFVRTENSVQIPGVKG